MIEVQYFEFVPDGVVQRQHRMTALRWGPSSRRAGSSSTPGSAPPTRGSAPSRRRADRGARLRPPLGLRPRRDGAAPGAHPLLRGVHDAGRALAGHLDRAARPDGHLRVVPQRRPARERGRVRRRVLRRPADPRARRRLVLAGVPGLRLRVPVRPRAAAGPRRDARRRQGLWTEETFSYDGQAPALRRRVLRPEADPVAAADLGRWRRREGDAAHRRAARRRDELAVRLGRLPPQVRAGRRSTARRSAARTRSCAPTRRTAASSTPRPTCDAGSTRPTAVTSGERTGSTRRSTPRTPSSAPSSRSPRRSALSSTRAPPSSSSGSATTRAASPSSAS